jgi:hypothetical protein
MAINNPLGQGSYPSVKKQLRNPTVLMSLIVVTVCAIRFLFDGLSITIKDYTLTIGHMDSLAYGSILTPVLAAHGYIRSKLGNKKVDKNGE